MSMHLRRWIGLTVLALAAIVCGCSPPTGGSSAGTPTVSQTTEGSDQSDADLQAELAKLSPADRAAAEAQRWCAVNTGERLGAMGRPVKLIFKGQPVFLCCKGCQKRAEADPDKTLAKVENLKAKAKELASPK